MAEKRILVVDDDTNYRELIYEYLSRKGYQVLTAPGGKEAIELIRQEKPDLVLLDLIMPVMDGIEVLSRVRSEGLNPRVVVLTGLSARELEEKARASGACGFLEKQMDLQRIVGAVDSILKEGGQEGKKILVVDDNPGIRDLLERFLKKKGYDPFTAANAEEALEKIKKENPVIVLLDISLPGMDGLMAIKKIKETSPSASVIMITGAEDQKMAEEAMRLGAADYIVKPLDLDYLEMTLLTKIILENY